LSKILGIVTAPTIGGIDYQLNKITAKLEQEKIEYVPMGAPGGWKTTLPGGAQVLSGSFEGAADTAGLGQGMTPYSSSTNVTFSLICGLSFSAVITDVELEQSSTGLATIKGNYQGCNPILR
jgi:hypothetical protein